MFPVFLYKQLYYIAHLEEQCHNSKYVIFREKLLKDFEELSFSMSATTTQLLSNGEICKLRYGAILVKSVFAYVYFYTTNSKMPNFQF